MDYATIKLTNTMLVKSTIDANKSVVDFLHNYTPFSYDTLKDGEKLKIPALLRLTDGEPKPSKITIYIRSRNAKILSIRGIRSSLTEGQTLRLTANELPAGGFASIDISLDEASA